MSVAKFTLPGVQLPLIGTVVNSALFGMLLVQVYIYFSVFKDRMAWKFIVILIVVLEVVETFTGFRDLARMFGSGWGDPNALDEVGLAWFSAPIMGSTIAFICQIFYGWRIYIIGNSVFIFAVISLPEGPQVSVVQLGAGIWTGVRICMLGRFSLLQFHNVIPTAIWLATTSLSDLLIVLGTFFVLRRSTDPEFTSRRTSSIVARVIVLTAETGAMCMAFALVDLFLFLKYKDTSYHLSVCIELSKIYSNSILVIFNSRAHIEHRSRNCTTMDQSVSLHLTGSPFRTQLSATTMPSSPGFRTKPFSSVGTVEVGVHVSEWCEKDENPDSVHCPVVHHPLYKIMLVRGVAVELGLHIGLATELMNSIHPSESSWDRCDGSPYGLISFDMASPHGPGSSLDGGSEVFQTPQWVRAHHDRRQTLSSHLHQLQWGINLLLRHNHNPSQVGFDSIRSGCLASSPLLSVSRFIRLSTCQPRSSISIFSFPQAHLKLTDNVTLKHFHHVNAAIRDP
ncbi:hypothetical protein K438DRAFT_1937048 [Mycena galopus ATCC 62051]|nr:hypothetical protein K438DRAFT_1937048 [Mycena galopus ATCC 62051]